MKSLMSTCVGLLLAGCSLVSPRIEYIEVPVKVPVACDVQPPVVPAFPFEQAKKEDDIEIKVRLLAADRFVRIGYIQELEVALTGCLKIGSGK